LGRRLCCSVRNTQKTVQPGDDQIVRQALPIREAFPGYPTQGRRFPLPPFADEPGLAQSRLAD
jgi:hypothetical protein